MREAIYIELDELAKLREKAALLCEETKGLIEDNRRLRIWAGQNAPSAPNEAASPAPTLPDEAAARPAELPRSPASGLIRTRLPRASSHQTLIHINAISRQTP